MLLWAELGGHTINPRTWEEEEGKSDSIELVPRQPGLHRETLGVLAKLIQWHLILIFVWILHECVFISVIKVSIMVIS